MTTGQHNINQFENSREKLFRTHWSSKQRKLKFIKSYSGFILAGCLVLALIKPGLFIPSFIVFSVLSLMTLPVRNLSKWLLRAPIYQQKNEKKVENTGLLYLGSAIDQDKKAIWFNQIDLTTHGLVLGTTGSGKTQLLLSMMNQFIAMGSGFIFCDGKGDVATWFYLYSMAKQLGMEDNITVINFLTAGQTKAGRKTKFSNTFNPFACGTSDALMEMISGFMGSGSNDSSMWRGRAEALGRCLLRALCELRDAGELELSVETIRAYLPLHQIEVLAEHPLLSDFTRDGIGFYLGELPSYHTYKEASKQNTEEAIVAANEAKKTAYEQHGYLTMQFTKTLEMLSGTYAHITKTDLAEVDFKDIITNRRILYIMLPALEKSPESLKDLGRIVVTSIRNALASLLGGDQLTGDRQSLLDSKPTHSDRPYGIFLDEYGSYAVDGFGDIGAQARSLNISVWFAGQEFDSFKKGSEIEASRILSNTGIKIFMKTESDTTTKIANERAGETYVYAANQVKRNETLFSDRTIETDNYSVQKVNRITKEDLVRQKPGECHVFFGHLLWRVKGFYGDFTLVNKTHLNTFIKVKKIAGPLTWSPSEAKDWEKEAKLVSHPNNLKGDIFSALTQKEQCRV